MRGDADQVADVRNRRASNFSFITLLMARTNNTRFGRSANALGLELIWSGSVGLTIFSRGCFMLELVRGTLDSIQRS